MTIATPPSESLAISTAGLTRRFGAMTAVDGLDLAVPAGAVTGFLGPNGAGKTTTIRMLLGLIRADGGDVRLFGRPLASDRIALLRRVGALVEMPTVYAHLTGAENLEVVRRLLDVPRSAIDRALGIVQLADAASRRAGDYSLGMKQRLGLAMALLGAPDLLILDEPTNGLDPAGIQEMRALIVALAADHGITVFLSSHLLGEVEQVATRLAIINRGRMIFQGALRELMERRQPHLAVGVDRPGEAAERLRAAGFDVTPGGADVRVAVPGGRDDAARVNALLTQAGHAVWSLTLEEPSLEDLFMGLTR